MSERNRDADTPKLTRRSFIEGGTKLGAGIVLSPLVLNLSACSHARNATHESHPTTDGQRNQADPSHHADPSAGGAGESTASASLRDGAVLLGLYPGGGAAALRAAVSKLDFSWLKKGDSVLIKVASNSGNPHPASTSAAGVKGMVAELKARGAGRVIVADQAGVEWVRRSAKGRYSSTRERFKTNGLLSVEGEAEMCFFDDRDFNAGYMKASLPAENRWPRGLYITRAIGEVDHIVYMPRIAAHTLTGLTLGQKMAIGWLRDDSRHDLHHDARDFYEKYTEVNYVHEIRTRFRMVVTVAEKVLLHGGPDEGTVHGMSPVLVVASTDLANHDAVASSVLVTLNAGVERGDFSMLVRYNSSLAPWKNAVFCRMPGASSFKFTQGEAGPWVSGSSSSRYTAHSFEQGITHDRSIQRGWALSGGRPESISVMLDGKPIAPELKAGLTKHGQDMYRFS